MPTETEYARQAATREANRVAVIDAGRDLFYERGYAGTSLAMISERAGVSTATLFKRFPTKASVLEAVIEREWVAARVEPSIADVLAEHGGDVRRALGAVGRDFAGFLRRPGTADLFRLIIAEVRAVPELASLRPRLVDGAYFTTVRDLLHTARTPDDTAVHDPDTTARRFVGLIAGQILWPILMDPDRADTTDADQNIVDSAIQLVLASELAQTEA